MGGQRYQQGIWKASTRGVGMLGHILGLVKVELEVCGKNRRGRPVGKY